MLESGTHRYQPSVRLAGFRSAAIRNVLLKIGKSQGLRDEVRSKGLKVLIAGGNAFVEEFLKLAAAFLQLSGSARDARPEFVVCTNGNDLGGDFLRRYPLVDLIARVRFIEDEPSGVAWAPTLEGLRFDVAVVSLPTEAETLSMSERLVRTSRLNVGHVYAMVPSVSDVQMDLNPQMERISISHEGCESLEFADVELELGARKHHEAYMESEKKEGRSVPEWETLPEFLKESNRWVFLHGKIKDEIRSALKGGSSEVLDEVERHLAECEHQRWMGERIMDGWVYGPAKDPEKRTHPSLKPFDELSSEEQEKDFVQAKVSG
ncbi:MAG: RyR domain-containing protein, partial [Chthoniobacteraceae bacterium]|nr:RyR domain-containing protein [Chthoniobacteraceae bacterium]